MRSLRVEETEVRIHEPDGEGERPLLVWFGDALSPWPGAGEELLADLAAEAGCSVARVDYAADGIETFPQPLSRAYRCLLHLQAEAGEAPVAVGGDGFGAGLAAATSILARRYGDRPVAARVLLTPLLDASLASPSWRRLGREEDVERLEEALNAYAPGLDRADPLLSPLLDDDLGGLPPTVIVTAWNDPMRDDGERYAERLRSAGAVALGHRYPGLDHAAACSGNATDGGAAVLRGLAAALRLVMSRSTQRGSPSSSR